MSHLRQRNRRNDSCPVAVAFRDVMDLQCPIAISQRRLETATHKCSSATPKQRVEDILHAFQLQRY